MKVLLTGVSSFTGTWFASSLAQKGASVVATLRNRIGDYSGVRRARLDRLAGIVELVECVTFGSDRFLELVHSVPFDVLCHHAAEVDNYRSVDFDYATALKKNTNNVATVLKCMEPAGLRAVVVTGSVFEENEGIGEHPHRAFSPYGLSKGMTWQVINYWCEVLGIPAAKFVIANPFGPFEERRFCAYLMEQWKEGKAAVVRTPLYLRDNIHVDLLAASYAKFVFDVTHSRRAAKIGVSGYQESQGAFAMRVASEVRQRTNLDCKLELSVQSEFSEPMVRLNPNRPEIRVLPWDEAKAWDDFTCYYTLSGK